MDKITLGGTYKDVGEYRINTQIDIAMFLNGILPYCLVKKEKVIKTLEIYKETYGWEITRCQQTV